MATVSIHIDGADAAAYMLGDISAKIQEGIAKGVSSAGDLVTAAAKANCPVRTGHLRTTIEKNASGNTCEVGTNCEYAGYLEFGTYKMAAQPYMVPALLENTGEIAAIVQDEVNKAIGK